MIATYKITLLGKKGFFREYEIGGEMSLYVFHKQMVLDMSLPRDCRILFKGFSEDGEVVARYALRDIGSGSVDNISIADTINSGVTSFTYFYDADSRKSLNIELVKIDENSQFTHMSPDLIGSKGPEPEAFENGFIAYEDRSEEERKLDEEEGYDGVY